MNKWLGMGRLTRDPEIRYSQIDDTLAIAKYTLAVDRRGEGADFISCVAFGRNAEFAEKYLKKGTKIAVEGHIQTGSYKNKDGNTVYTTDIIIDAQEFAESKKAEATAPADTPSDMPDFMNLPDIYDEELPFN